MSRASPVFFERGETHARGRVAAGAEDQAGIEPQRLTPVGGYLFPFRYDDQLFADLDGLIIFAPVVLPVAVLDKRCLHRAVCAAYFRKDGLAVGVVAEVALYAADAANFCSSSSST